MTLVLDVVRLLAGKLVAVVLVVSVATASVLAWTWVRERREWVDRAADLRVEVDAAQRAWREHRLQSLDAEKQLNALEAARPNPLLQPGEYVAWKGRMQVAEAAVAASRRARDRAKEVYDEGLVRLREAEAALGTLPQRFWDTARGSAWMLAAAVGVFLFGPMAWKAVWYYGVAPLAAGARRMQLVPAAEPGECREVGRGKSVEAEVAADRPLLARMEWVQAYAPGLKKRTRFLFDWRSPFTSYAAGLREMTEFRVPSEGMEGGVPRVTLASVEDPDVHLLAVALDAHPGLVLKPGAVVAVSGDVRMMSRWRWTCLHAWIAGRLRHILFAGTGTLYIAGRGRVDFCVTEQTVAVEEALVLGADARLEYGTVRTETFWPYFRGRTSLFDYRFGGGRPYLRQTAVPLGGRGSGNWVTRTLEGTLGALGRLLGF